MQGIHPKVSHMKSALFFILLLTIPACGYEQVNEGYRGIKTEWGKMVGEPLMPNLYFYNPISSAIFEMDVREQKIQGRTPVFTKDTQRVDVEYAVNYYPDPKYIGALYSQFGVDWAEKIIPQVVLSSMKDSIGQIIADDLVSNRESAQQKSEDELKDILAKRNIVATSLKFTNLDFDDAYERAVEAKVVAIQQAAEAKNRTVKIEEEAKQTVMSAEASAKAMRIKSEALKSNKGLADYEAVQRWDGKLPQIILGGGSIPMIDLKNFTK